MNAHTHIYMCTFINRWLRSKGAYLGPFGMRNDLCYAIPFPSSRYIQQQGSSSIESFGVANVCSRLSRAADITTRSN